jgi:adenylate cyclase, class 2
MLEVEMKFAVADFASIKKCLRDWNASADEAIDEADQYFNAPDRDFAQTDEAFRLRRIGPKNMLTYKGPKAAGVVKTRTEIEVSIAQGPIAAEDMSRLLVHLGYRPVAVVHKRRRIFHLQREGFALEVCLDEVAEVGQFVEVEIVTPPERKDEAEKVLQQTAAELGLSADHLIRRSYLGMLLERRGNKNKS